jgi:hypothetical protein
MKRFGLPMLLSAGYAGLLFLVFSSDFSREHSFLLKESDSISPKAKIFEKSMAGIESGFVSHRAELQLPESETANTSPTKTASNGHSPESANENHQ